MFCYLLTIICRPNVGVMSDSNSFSSPEMITPNLDKLAARSLVLTNAYTQVDTEVTNDEDDEVFDRLLCVVPADLHSSLAEDQTPSDAMTMKTRPGSIFLISSPCLSTSRRTDTKLWQLGKYFIQVKFSRLHH